MSQNLTVHDIARLAGVSAMTVSRVLNQPDKVSPATRAKVQAVVQHTGFVPNGMAGGLRSSKAKLVAAVLPTLVGPVFQETTRALNAALDARGYQLMIGQSGYDVSREDSLLDAIIRRRPELAQSLSDVLAQYQQEIDELQAKVRKAQDDAAHSPRGAAVILERIRDFFGLK